MSNVQAMLVMGCGVAVAAISQLILKKAAVKQYSSWLRSYLNFHVMFGYFLMVVSTVCSVLAYRVLPLTVSPLFTAIEQVIIALMSVFILKEKANRRKWLGLGLILLGIGIYALPV